VPRVVAYVKEDAQTTLADAQDLLDEARDVALARSLVYHQSLYNYHSRRVRGQSFEPGNLVLHLKQTRTSKLEPPWEGPYLIHEAIPGGHIDYATPRQGWTLRTHGTPRSCAGSILRADRSFLPFSLSVTKCWQQTMLIHHAFGAKQ
jgi:hypothetical protein